MRADGWERGRGGIEDASPKLRKDGMPRASKAPSEDAVRVTSDRRFIWHAFLAGLGSLVVIVPAVVLMQVSLHTRSIGVLHGCCLRFLSISPGLLRFCGRLCSLLTACLLACLLTLFGLQSRFVGDKPLTTIISSVSLKTGLRALKGL